MDCERWRVYPQYEKVEVTKFMGRNSNKTKFAHSFLTSTRLVLNLRLLNGVREKQYQNGLVATRRYVLPPRDSSLRGALRRANRIVNRTMRRYYAKDGTCSN